MFAIKRYDCYSATIGEPLVIIRYIGLSKASRLTTLRLFRDCFIGETTTIGNDYSRTCYDYSSRDATTIARPYWLSGESPKRDAAVAANSSAPPAALQTAGLLRRVEGDRLTRCQIASRRVDPVQVEALTPQQVRRVQHLPEIYTRQELTPPGWHGLRYASPLYTLL